jgi:heme/copper-type cytochrome/quinol oxidase subunit 4
MPFTHEQFFDLFGRYNRAVPLAIGLCWGATAVLAASVVRGRHASTALLTLMVFQWAWVGIVFHLVFFTSINPAAWALPAGGR